MKHRIERRSQFSNCLRQAGVIVIAHALISCGEDANVAAERFEQEVMLTPAALVAERTSLSGTVKVLGLPSVLRERKVDVGQNPFCAEHEAQSDPTWKVTADDAFADVFITVLGSERASNIDEEPLLIDQHYCMYVPTALVMQPGQTLAVKNSDLTYHNVRLIAHEKGSLNGGINLVNMGQPPQGEPWLRPLRRSGVYRLECDIHRWMKAWVYVHEGIHAAVSDASGRYQITRALADGEYEVEAWHPRFADPLRTTARIIGGVGSADFVFDFTRSFDFALSLTQSSS